jgi:repressor LexA
MALTKRQRQVLDFLDTFIKKHGYCPSFEEIGKGMKLSSLATVHKHVTNLEKKGMLRRDYNRSRSIDIIPQRGRKLPPPPPPLEFPLVGRIAAGMPVETFEQPETINLNDLTKARDVFVLEVSGDSMQDEHIVSGDYVLVERIKVPRDGDIVVALVDGSDTTLKRIYREGDTIRLQPSNTSMKPIMVPAGSVQVQGRVIGVLRKY